MAKHLRFWRALVTLESHATSRVPEQVRRRLGDTAWEQIKFVFYESRKRTIDRLA